MIFFETRTMPFISVVFEFGNPTYLPVSGLLTIEPSLLKVYSE